MAKMNLLRLLPKQTQHFFEEIDDLLEMIEKEGGGGREERDQKIMYEGIALILLALERICFLLSIGIGLLIGITFKL